MERLRSNIQFGASILAFLLVFSCNLFESDSPGPEARGKIWVSFTADLQARTLEPGISLDVATYDLAADGPDGAHFEVVNLSVNSYTKGDLEPGSWTVSAIGRNATGTAIAAATQIVQVQAELTAGVTLICLPIAGSGTLTLSLTWPADSVENPEVQATLRSESGVASTSLAFTTSNGLASFPGGTSASNSFPSGYYILDIQLKDGVTEELAWIWTDTVLICSDLTTPGNWTLSYGLGILVTSDTNKPIVVGLAGMEGVIEVGQSMTVQASGTPTPTAWQWLLDGQVVSGAIGAEVTVGSDLTVGLHVLTAIAGRDGSYGSAGFGFLVRELQQPAGTAAVNFVVNDAANRVFQSGDLCLKGSFIYDTATGTMTLDSMWSDPLAALHDDGPWPFGGHEPIGSVAGDHIWGLTAFITPDDSSTLTIEYGLVDHSDGDAWIWSGSSNGSFDIEPGDTSTITATGQTFPLFGTTDLKLVLDTNGLDSEIWNTDTVQVKGSLWYWHLISLSDDGTKGDAIASDGFYTFVLSEHVGTGTAYPHIGLARSGETADFVFVLGPAEYKDVSGNSISAGVTAFIKAQGSSTWTLTTIGLNTARDTSFTVP